MAEKLVLKTEDLPGTHPDPMEALRDNERRLLAEKNALLEQELADMKMRRSAKQNDAQSRAAALQMINDDEDAPRKGVVHISQFAKHDLEYRGKVEDVENLKATLEA